MAPMVEMTPSEPASFRFLCRVLAEGGNEGAGQPFLEGLSNISSTEWDEIFAAAQVHQLAPLLYHRLGANGGLAAATEQVQDELHQEFLKHTGRNAIAYYELGRIVETLQQQGIPVIALKGAFLAAHVYDHLGHRPMGDLDLLVPRHELMAATLAVQRLGYDYTYPGDAPIRYTPESAEAIASQHKHVPRLYKRHAFAVELHWNLVRPDSGWNLDLDALWERSQPVTLGNVAVRSLAPEDLLLHICLHAVCGNRIALNIGLRPFCDLLAIVRRYRRALDWSRVISRAQEWQAGSAIALMLGLARRLLSVPVPEDCLAALRLGNFDPAWESWARAQIWTSVERGIYRLPPAVVGTLQAVSCLAAAPVAERWRLAWTRLFGSRRNSIPAASGGKVGTLRGAQPRRYLLKRFSRIAKMLAFAARRPPEAWFWLKTFRTDARFRAWLQHEASRCATASNGIEPPALPRIIPANS